jgi:hypothetical protein
MSSSLLSSLLIELASSLNGVGVVLLSGDVLKEGVLDLLDLLLHLLLLGGCNLFWVITLGLLWGQFGVIGQLLHDLKILLPSELSLKDLLHGLLLTGGGLVEWLAQLHDRDCSLSIADSCHVLVH